MQKTLYRIKLRTKNYSAEELKKELYQHKYIVPAIIRLGSLTETKHITRLKNYVEINTIDSIRNSRDKLLMKQKFTEFNVKTAPWFTSDNLPKFEEINYPIVAKSRVSQGGKGNTLIHNIEEFKTWFNNHKNNLENYIFEQYFNGAREYGIHVTKEGYFLAWRKLRKADSTDRWFFNSSNCVWVGENNPLFDKPFNWEDICQECVKALVSVGLDIGRMDVRIQSSKDKDGNVRKNCDFIILESNSAPSLGDRGTEYYTKEIRKLIEKKIRDAAY